MIQENHAVFFVTGDIAHIQLVISGRKLAGRMEGKHEKGKISVFFFLLRGPFGCENAGLLQPFFQLRKVGQAGVAAGQLRGELTVHRHSQNLIRFLIPEDLGLLFSPAHQLVAVFQRDAGQILPKNDDQICPLAGKLLRLFEDLNALQSFQHIVPAPFAQQGLFGKSAAFRQPAVIGHQFVPSCSVAPSPASSLSHGAGRTVRDAGSSVTFMVISAFSLRMQR